MGHIAGVGPGNPGNSGEKVYVKLYNADSEANATQAGFVYNENGADTVDDWITPAADVPGFVVNVFSADTDIKGIQNGGVNFTCEVEAKPGLAVFVIRYGVEKLLVCFRMKWEFHMAKR